VKREHLTTAHDRPVWRYTFESDETSPTLRAPSITPEAASLVAEALGLGRSLDARRVTVAELAEGFDACPEGAAVARYIDGQGRVVLHIVGVPSRLFDENEVPDGRPGIDKLLTKEAADLALQLDDAQAQVADVRRALAQAKADAALYLRERDEALAEITRLRVIAFPDDV